MSVIFTSDDLLQRLEIGEDQDTEFKLADGGLPHSIWPTISAFANTEGGYIILGVKQQKERFEIIGVKNPTSILKAFWDTHNNTAKLSVNLCTSTDVQILTIENHQIIIIHIPHTRRTQRPVYINANPMKGTYKRNHEGDYHCTEVEVRQMLRDASDQPHDLLILEKFGLDDLDKEALKAFRQRFISRDPDHPFHALNDSQFLHQLGGWHHDRVTGKEGLTLAGLLMFGRESSLLEALPFFQLDYQEQLSDNSEERWTYRLTVDGKWDCNLFNFYYRIYPRLVEGLDIPFKLDKDAVRLGETHVREALREALVNTLVHADYENTRAIKIVKKKDRVVFENPGRLRIPKEDLYKGGVSDPRNPKLQRMFQMIGLGEKAGSGFQKILRAWKEQAWLYPLVFEELKLDITRIVLPMMSMIPQAVEQELKEVVGENYSALSELDRVVLVLAHRFGEISNGDIKRYRAEHPRDIGDRLKYLLGQGWLERSGHGRGTYYNLPKAQPLISSEHRGLSSEHRGLSSEHRGLSSEHRGLSSEHYQVLKELAMPIKTSRRVQPDVMRDTILAICAENFIPLKLLSSLLGRKTDSLRNHYINPMVETGLLILHYPEQINHPQQGYKKP